MSEDSQTITEMLETKRMFRAAKRVRRIKASRCFSRAASLAKDSGLRLVRHSESHYALSRKGKFGWILNIYPGNLRLMPDKKKRTPPELDLPDIWGLLDVVKSATRIKAPSPARRPSAPRAQAGDFDIKTFCDTGEVRQISLADLPY